MSQIEDVFILVPGSLAHDGRFNLCDQDKIGQLARAWNAQSVYSPAPAWCSYRSNEESLVL